MREGNVLQASVHGGLCITSPTVLLASGQYTSYCNAVLFKLGLNHEMYSWVVHFLNYFMQEVEEGGKVQVKFFFL